MKCPVCGNPADPCKNNMGKLLLGFEITLGSTWEQYTNIPCFMRIAINLSMGKTMPVKSYNGDLYMFELERRKYKTRIYGPDYNQFLKDYDMQHHDRVDFQFEDGSTYLSMEPLTKKGYIKDRVEVEHEFQTDATAVVFSKGVDPTHSELSMIDDICLERGLGLGAVFVHRLTKTDIRCHGLRIPKSIVSTLNITPSGTATLVFREEDGAEEAEYTVTADGRLHLKNGWFKFAKDNALDIGMMVLIMFHKDEDDIQISVDVIGN